MTLLKYIHFMAVVDGKNQEVLKGVRCVGLEDFLRAKNSRIFSFQFTWIFDEYSYILVYLLSHSASNFW